jgi:hypothetical protein
MGAPDNMHEDRRPRPSQSAGTRACAHLLHLAAFPEAEQRAQRSETLGEAHTLARALIDEFRDKLLLVRARRRRRVGVHLVHGTRADRGTRPRRRVLWRFVAPRRQRRHPSSGQRGCLRSAIVAEQSAIHRRAHRDIHTGRRALHRPAARRLLRRSRRDAGAASTGAASLRALRRAPRGQLCPALRNLHTGALRSGVGFGALHGGTRLTRRRASRGGLGAGRRRPRVARRLRGGSSGHWVCCGRALCACHGNVAHVAATRG